MSFGALSPKRGARAERGAPGRAASPTTPSEGRCQPLSPRERRRHHLGNRLRLFRFAATGDGSFNPEEFARVATDDQIKMVELKVSQGAKPGHGGVLPAAKVSEEISKIRGVAMGEDCISPAYHHAFSTPLENDGLHRRDAAAVRRQAGRIFKLCVGHPWEFLAICKAMLQTGIYPDFIVVDGNEGGTGCGARWSSWTIWALPMREGGQFSSTTR